MDVIRIAAGASKQSRDGSIKLAIEQAVNNKSSHNPIVSRLSFERVCLAIDLKSIIRRPRIKSQTLSHPNQYQPMGPI